MNLQKLTVGVFGYYSCANYGDNLMAHMIYRHLESVGARPVLFASDSFFRDQYGMASESSLEAFVEQSDVVILGGGGLLTPVHQKAALARFNSEMRELVALCGKRNVPIYGVSIGGNGLPIEQIEPIERRRLFVALQYTTLRNQRDFLALMPTSKPSDVFPDIVWATSRFFPPATVASNGRTRIGINLFMRGGRARLVLKFMLRQLIRLKPDWEFVFIDVNPNDVQQGGSFDLTSYGGKNCSKVVLHELRAASELIGSLTLLVTNKLHIGVVAMSYGIPVVSYAGEPKTRLLFADVGLSALCWNRNQVIQKFVSCFLLPGGMSRVRKIHSKLDIQKKITGAMNHFAALTKIVDFHKANASGAWTPSGR